MRELYKLALDGMNMLSAVVIGIPLLLISFALLASMFTKHDGIRVRGGEDCGIAGVANCRLFGQVTTKDGHDTVDKKYHFEFLPGQWEKMTRQSIYEYWDCYPRSAKAILAHDEDGQISQAQTEYFGHVRTQVGQGSTGSRSVEQQICEPHRKSWRLVGLS